MLLLWFKNLIEKKNSLLSTCLDRFMMLQEADPELQHHLGWVFSDNNRLLQQRSQSGTLKQSWFRFWLLLLVQAALRTFIIQSCQRELCNFCSSTHQALVSLREQMLCLLIPLKLNGRVFVQQKLYFTQSGNIWQYFYQAFPFLLNYITWLILLLFSVFCRFTVSACQ